MKFIEKRSETEYLLHLHVKPNYKKFTVREDNEYLILTLLSKPVKNKANKELITYLRNKLDLSSTQIKILAGLKSTNKIIQLNFPQKTSEQAIFKKLTS